MRGVFTWLCLGIGGLLLMAAIYFGLTAKDPNEIQVRNQSGGYSTVGRDDPRVRDAVLLGGMAIIGAGVLGGVMVVIGGALLVTGRKRKTG